MQLVEIDLTAIAGILMGGLVLVIPIIGLTARLTIPPIVEAVARARAAHSSTRAIASLEARFARLERRLGGLAPAATPDRVEDETERVLASLTR